MTEFSRRSLLAAPAIIAADFSQFCASLPQIEIVGSTLPTPNKIKNVVIVGNSGCGKTTMVNSIRAMPHVTVPKRVLTRPPRLNDDLTENIHLGLDGFEELSRNGGLMFSWPRQLGRDRWEYYGFVDTPQPLSERILVFSANNALAVHYNATGMPSQLQANDTLWISIEANNTDVFSRLTMRSPDLFASNPEEIQKRLSDKPSEMRAFVNLVIKNTNQKRNAAIESFVSLIEYITNV